MIQFYNNNADIHVPDGADAQNALKRTTHMSIAAHQDDCEIMAYSAILQCYGSNEHWYSGIVLTDGGGSPRSGKYAGCTDEEISIKRSQEQRDAADLGKYSSITQLAYTSAQVRGEKAYIIEDELIKLLTIATPEIMIIHNPTDRHETHVGAFIRAINAIRGLPCQLRPKKVYGVEVWRSLDWLSDKDKKLFDTSENPDLAHGLIAAFESQCTPKKRFDLAAIGRRMGNATFQAPRDIDEMNSCNIGVDLTELITRESVDIREFALNLIDNFYADVDTALSKLIDSKG